MRQQLLPVIFGALIVMSSACAQPPTTGLGTVARISVLASGKLLLNDNPTDIAAIDAELQRQKTNGGTVWYYRENGQAEPPAEAMAVIELIVNNGLPVSMSTQPDFSDYVDGNGQIRAREP